MVQTPTQGSTESNLTELSSTQSLTLAEFLALPETKPASEFIDGQICQKPMPKIKHSVLQREITFSIDRPLRKAKIARAFPELRCTFGGRSTVPDIAVLKLQRIPRQPDGTVADNFEAYPDWTIEILSPDQRQTRVIKNIMHCLKHGTQMGWLIDPEEETVFVYYPDREMEIFDEPEAMLPPPDFAPGVEISVGTLFSWLSD